MTGEEVRAGVVAEGPVRWRIEVVAADRIGLLSRVASAMNGLGFDIEDAVVCTWPDGAALTSFGVHRAEPPLASEVEDRVRAALRGELGAPPGLGCSFRRRRGETYTARCNASPR